MLKDIINHTIVLNLSDYEDFPELTERLHLTVNELSYARTDRSVNDGKQTVLTITEADCAESWATVQDVYELGDELEYRQHLRAMYHPTEAEADAKQFPGNND